MATKFGTKTAVTGTDTAFHRTYF